MSSPFHRVHRALYSATEALRPSPCRGLAEFVGTFRVRELGRKTTLFHCPHCDRLIACADGKVLWETQPPPAAVPVASEEGAAP